MRARVPGPEVHDEASDDDRDGAAVGAPRGAGDVARARRAEERDDRRDLLRLGQPAERAPGADRGEHLVARLAAPRRLLVGEARPRRATPRSRSGRA